ncbi:rhamnogalacturonan acetylesterase [Luteolibacter arcticus]|uniref:Rhamnogalacturonan acetylesterase n=1 Tax=Luteolibacter arcticus TaxID=1581411 RepID=A0ABT3GMC7_9BACT|nr:rhamnogalacturonan acetylesterase [Luteolibacter arcticus]MCW1924679.1 rhamnogalacturonan acetylesterase [Luteolibacter arcticus]
MTPRHFRQLLVLFAAAPLLLSADDDRPVVDDSQVKKEVPASPLPTLWIAGDSTVKNQGAMRGWGQDIPTLLDTTKIQVVNRAIGGRSSRTFFTEGRWDDILKTMKTGDIVLVQFGHNDVGALDERGKFRGSVRGIGEETEQVKKPDGSVETVHSYGWYLKHFARTAKAKGAVVVLCSPVPHKKFDREGKFVRDWDQWRGWVKDCATAEDVLYLDLAELVGTRYAEMKPAEVEALFADKGTHTNAAGAMLNAHAVIDGLNLLSDNPLAKFLPKAAGTPP